MAMKKKGFVFTFMSIILILTLFFISANYNSLRNEESLEFLNQRVTLGNNYVSSIEEGSIPKLVEFYSVKSMESIISKISSTGNAGFKNDFKRYFENNININKLAKTIKLTSKMDLIDFKIEIMEINQSEPFKFDIYYNYSYLLGIKPKANGKYLAQWNRTIITNQSISLSNFNDPFLKIHNINRKIINVNNLITNQITLEGKFEKMLDEHAYNIEPRAPSFFDKIKGDFEAQSDCCGIESFISGSEGTKSHADFCYFRDIPQNPNHPCGGQFAIKHNTKITSYHVLKYGLS